MSPRGSVHDADWYRDDALASGDDDQWLDDWPEDDPDADLDA